MMRNIYLVVESCGYWDYVINFVFLDLVKIELEFWINNLVKMNYKCLIVEFLFFVLVFLDVSNVVVGVYMVEVDEKIVYYIWLKFELLMSFMWRELKVIDLVLNYFVVFLLGKVV